MSKNNIFEVDIKGLRQLQEGKPKWFIPRELLQNAFDENITTCEIILRYKLGKAYITVTDDSPIGFRDLADAYTLFKDTYKRTDVKKRGRFNFGEKQVLCLSDFARIVTTTGGLEFDVLGGSRTTLRRKRDAGSEVHVVVRMTRDEFSECCDYAKDILVPQNVRTTLITDEGESELQYVAPYKTFSAKLLTEKKEEDRMRTISVITDVNIHKPVSGKPAYIYEMGIPICEIDCNYSIDVQQKVPLSNDRDNVDAKYLKTLYGEVLNQVHDEIKEDQASALWVRNGFTSDRTSIEARKTVITQRFGDKPLIANPMDKRSIDEATSHNHNLIYGAEMSKEEWEVVREDKLIISSSAMFKTGVADGKFVTPTKAQKRIADIAAKIANEFLNLRISVSFYDSPNATVKADFAVEGSSLRFNVAHFTDSEWELVESFRFSFAGGNPESIFRPKQDMMDLLIHELGHSAGWHYEHSYHECITLLGSKLWEKAIEDPRWFSLKESKPQAHSATA